VSRLCRFSFPELLGAMSARYFRRDGRSLLAQAAAGGLQPQRRRGAAVAFRGGGVRRAGGGGDASRSGRIHSGAVHFATGIFTLPEAIALARPCESELLVGHGVGPDIAGRSR